MILRIPSMPFLPTARPRRVRGTIQLLLLLLSCAGVAGEAFAQTNLRNVFPGRRVGGGTRGECTARVLAHLVPPSSVYAPGATTTLGVLEGPTTKPHPLAIEFRPLRSGGTAEGAQAARVRRTVPAGPVGVTLITVPSLRESTVWETSYDCEPPLAAGATDPLAFVTAAAPPAVSLLLTEVTPADKPVQEGLRKLRSSCGASVAKADVAKTFGLDDVVTAEWPARIPVRCP
jgi:hypothetical protein